MDREALELVGCTDNLESKTAVISINNYRGVLPCDFEYEIAIKHDGVNIVYNSSLQKKIYYMNSLKTIAKILFILILIAIQLISLISIILFEIVTLSYFYKGLRIDGEGLPLVPDLIQFKEGCVLLCNE